MKAPERVELLQHILHEHNELCRRVAQFNKFWAKYLMNTYFLMITIVCFCSFQAFFTHNFIYVRILMFYFACLAAFLITKISMCAATMSTKVSLPDERIIPKILNSFFIHKQKCRLIHLIRSWFGWRSKSIRSRYRYIFGCWFNAPPVRLLASTVWTCLK